MKTKTTPVKHYILSLAFLSGSLVTQAQNPDLKEKKILMKNESMLVYHIDNDKQKEGPYYIKNSKSGQLLLKGAYTDNKRSGNWYFYDQAGKLESIYSYQQNKLAYIDSSLVNKLTINVLDKDKTVVENSQIPVLLSSIKLFLAEMSNNISIPEEHFIGQKALPIQIKSVINTNGEAQYSLIYKFNNKAIEHSINLKRSEFDIEWMPALYNKKPIKAEVIINTEISGSNQSGDNFRRFRWNEK